MSEKEDKTLAAIRRRDADYGDNIPDHWQAQKDRRFLLNLLDKAYQALENSREFQ